MSFDRVKQLLMTSMQNWEGVNGLSNLATHNTPGAVQFPSLVDGNYTKVELVTAVARGRRMIEDNMVGAPNGMGAQANLIVALRSGVSPFSRMPSSGPFMPDAEIQEIEDWISAGCPD